MLYSIHQLQRRLLDPVASVAATATRWMGNQSPFTRLAHANTSLLQRLIKDYPRQSFAITSVTAHGHNLAVTEHVVLDRPFCRLVRFQRHSTDAATTAALAQDPKVLLCAPLSGHHSTLLRDTIATLLHDHDVYLTDWRDARDVPAAVGAFSLDDYVRQIQECIRTLGAADLHVIAVCQPTVPVLAAVSLMASAGEVTPASLTLMGGPVDARRNPTAVNKFAVEHSFEWFKKNMIHRVPKPHAGAGRAVYPGFIQLNAFVMMNPLRHLASYQTYWLDQLRGPDGADAVQHHERFYDEYNAVLDMDAAYYLDTVRSVFQEFALAQGTWRINGQLVVPSAITRTALFTIEGAHDDISGLGQTEAAHGLCAGISAADKKHLVAEGCGHYGLFAGHRWRESIYPEISAFIRSHQRLTPTTTRGLTVVSSASTETRATSATGVISAANVSSTASVSSTTDDEALS